MPLMKFLHPPVILFLLLFGFIYSGMYFLSDVSPIQIFPSTVLAPEKPPSELGNIFEVDSFVYLLEYHYFLQALILLHWGGVLH